MGEDPFHSPSFDRDGSFRLDEPVGALSISPSGRDVVLASKQGLHIIDLDSPYAPPRYLAHQTRLEVADVQWSPFASRDHWVVSTSDSAALVWNLEAQKIQDSIDHCLWGREGHNRAISDINFSAHDPDVLATCSIDSFVLVWDLRDSRRPSSKFADWEAGAQQVKWNRKDPHILASAHNNRLHIWDDRKGIIPLHSFNAHHTKIYGIDWSRVDSTCILTCSLDKTIKLWNFNDFRGDNIEPLRTMHTDFPIWRARHTPFGSGVVAMPQRDDKSLHLYDRRTYRISDRNAKVQPTHSFTGHEGNVREFLWRYRGGVGDGIDNREWQLVTWGTDQQLMLHRVTEDMTRKVGYVKGEPASASINFTRKGAVYRTFHEAGESSRTETGTRQYGAREPRKNALGISESIESPKGKTQLKRGQVDALTWIKGVKLRNREGENQQGKSRPASASQRPMWRSSDDVGAEIAWVHDALAQDVEMSEIDVKRGRALVSFAAPWAEKGESCWFRCRVLFPHLYPTTDEPLDVDVDFPPTVTDATKTRLIYQLHAILDAHAAARRGCLEPAVRFLLGHWSFERSANALGDYADVDREPKADYLHSFGAHADEDEDEYELHHPLGTSTDLEGSGTVASTNKLANLNVPLPKACGAVFAANGRLVCFFPSKEQSPFASFKAAPKSFNDPDELEKQEIFQQFDREHFHEDPDSDPAEQSADEGSSSSSPSSSSSDASGGSLFITQNPIAGYRKGGSTFYEYHDSTTHAWPGDIGQPEGYHTGLSYVAIHDVDELATSKRSLAQEYMMTGPGETVCEHNAEVASKHGMEDLAHTWRLVALLLDNNVPLEQVMLHDNQGVLAVADVDLGSLEKHDSGTEDSTTSARLPQRRTHGRIRWGGFPFGGVNSCSDKPSLVERLLKRYEDRKDVQMLAMLSCVLAPAPQTDLSGDAMLVRDQASLQPFPLRHPTYSLPYFGSATASKSSEAESRSSSATVSRRGSRLRRPPGLTINVPPPHHLVRSNSSLSSSFSTSFKHSLSWLSTSTSPHDDPLPPKPPSSDALFPDPAPRGTVTLRYTNQSHFPTAQTTDRPLLPPSSTPKHLRWRAAYATQLGAWRLLAPRATMLKFNGPSATPAPPAARLAPVLRCPRCRALAAPAPDPADPARACPQCAGPLRRPQCAVCWHGVRAFAVACGRCGHATHAACARAWATQAAELAAECPAGCGCECGVVGGAGPLECVEVEGGG